MILCAIVFCMGFLNALTRISNILFLDAFAIDVYKRQVQRDSRRNLRAKLVLSPKLWYFIGKGILKFEGFEVIDADFQYIRV